METTLNAISAHNPHHAGLEKLLKYLGKTEPDCDPLGFDEILKAVGLYGALWCLRAVPGIEKELRILAGRFAERVLHIFEAKYPGDKRPRKAVELALKGEYDEEVAKDAAAAAADAAAYTSDAVWDASWETARKAEQEAQEQIFIDWLGQFKKGEGEIKIGLDWDGVAGTGHLFYKLIYEVSKYGLGNSTFYVEELHVITCAEQGSVPCEFAHEEKIHYCPEERLSDYHKWKAEVCIENGIDIMIDDDQLVVNECLNSGVMCLKAPDF